MRPQLHSWPLEDLAPLLSWGPPLPARMGTPHPGDKGQPLYLSPGREIFLLVSLVEPEGAAESEGIREVDLQGEESVLWKHVLRLGPRQGVGSICGP